jgi:hypothetical protein
MDEQQEALRHRNGLMAEVFFLRSRLNGRVRLDDARESAFVQFKGDAEYSLPRFRVYLHGELTVADTATADRLARPIVRRLNHETEQPFPVLLAVFSHADDRGWITWVTKPEGGELVPQSAPDCRPFDRAAMDDIVTAVR